jgi:hypothetical protein
VREKRKNTSFYPNNEGLCLCLIMSNQNLIFFNKTRIFYNYSYLGSTIASSIFSRNIF